MRSHIPLFSTMILTAATACARAQSLSSPESLLPNAPTPASVASPFPHDYLVPHDSRNEVPSIDLAAARSRLARQKQVLLARNTSVCYTVRAYNFPSDGSPDIAKPTSSTTCEVPKEGALKRSSGQVPR